MTRGKALASTTPGPARGLRRPRRGSLPVTSRNFGGFRGNCHTRLTATVHNCHIHSMALVDARWTIEELNELALSVLGADHEIGLRTIRYYAALGLIDRPAAMRGRKAFYGERHLLQLVSIKRMQAEGLSLETVQARMISASSNALRTIARVPEKILED